MKKEILKIALNISLAGLLIILIGFAGVKNSSRPVNDVKIAIPDHHGDSFIDQSEVLHLMNAEGTDYILGLPVGDLDLKQLEQRVKDHPFVNDVQVYKDLKGNLIVHVKQAKPVARIFNPRGKDFYIDEEGKMLPALPGRPARVPLLELEREFDWEENVTETSYGAQLLDFLLFVSKDKFWRAQVAGIRVERDGELVLHPQVTRQDIRFGMPEEVDKKFNKLKIFYKEILPNKGWNTYSVVNLKFDNQIICE